MRKHNLPSNAPGLLIHEELKERGWTQKDLAAIMRVSSGRVNDIITARRRITIRMAIGLSAAFGTTPQFWLTMDSAYQLSKHPMTTTGKE